MVFRGESFGLDPTIAFRSILRLSFGVDFAGAPSFAPLAKGGWFFEFFVFALASRIPSAFIANAVRPACRQTGTYCCRTVNVAHLFGGEAFRFRRSLGFLGVVALATT
jgi:hypothetical protein